MTEKEINTIKDIGTVIKNFILDSLKVLWNQMFDDQTKEFLQFLLLIVIIIVCLIIILKLTEGILWTKSKFEKSAYVPKRIIIKCPKCGNKFYALQDAYMMCDFCQSIVKVGRFYEGIETDEIKEPKYKSEDLNLGDTKE